MILRRIREGLEREAAGVRATEVRIGLGYTAVLLESGGAGLDGAPAPGVGNVSRHGAPEGIDPDQPAVRSLAGAEEVLATNPFQERMQRLQHLMHEQCVVCGATASHGLRVGFEALPDGSVRGHLVGPPDLEGYPGTLHGGIIASLLDGAMTNCLFAHGVVAVTGELNVRYRRPVVTDEIIWLRARIKENSHDLYQMVADLRQGGWLAATAKARFVPRP